MRVPPAIASLGSCRVHRKLGRQEPDAQPPMSAGCGVSSCREGGRPGPPLRTDDVERAPDAGAIVVVQPRAWFRFSPSPFAWPAIPSVRPWPKHSVARAPHDPSPFLAGSFGERGGWAVRGPPDDILQMGGGGWSSNKQHNAHQDGGRCLSLTFARGKNLVVTTAGVCFSPRAIVSVC